MCVRVCILHTCVWVSLEATWRHEMSQSWTHRRFQVIWHVCWDPTSSPLPEKQAFLTAETSLQPPKSQLLTWLMDGDMDYQKFYFGLERYASNFPPLSSSHQMDALKRCMHNWRTNETLTLHSWLQLYSSWNPHPLRDFLYWDDWDTKGTQIQWHSAYVYTTDSTVKY